jgi:hypothetical protein
LFDDAPAEEAQWSSYSAIDIPSSVPGANPTLIHPSIEQSNMLCKYFFECVNPFVRVVHEGLFARELREYRRGTFTHPPVFEALLFAIYTLTLSSLDADLVEKSFLCSKEILLARFKSSAQIALVKINFLQSDKVYVRQPVFVI